MYKVISSRQAAKDHEKLLKAGLSDKTKELARIIKADPYKSPPFYEKLSGDLQGFYPRRINKQHRFIYEILPNSDGFNKDENGEVYTGAAKILRMWTHYE